MRARVLLGVASVVGAVGMLWGSAAPALACSAGPDWDPVAASDVIVGGRITGWALIDDVRRYDAKTEEPPISDPNYYGPYDPIRVEMTVERVYKGEAPSRIEIVDGASLEVHDFAPAQLWVGAAGACGAFDFDPTGKYFVMGLAVDQFGRYRPNRLNTFFVGDSPPYDFTRPPLSFVESLLPGALPGGGGPPDGRDFPVLPAAMVSVIGPMAVLVGATLLWRPSKRPS